MTPTPNFPIVIQVRAEPREELLVLRGDGIPVESGNGTPVESGVQWLRYNAQDLRQLARQRDEGLFNDLCNLIEAAYLGVVHNQPPRET